MNTVSDSRMFDELGLTRRPEQRRDKLGQEDFLKLMVAQLRNQNPLQPMENGEFLTQIAQFGTVSGVRDLQASFRDLAAALYSNQALQAAGLVGRRVMAPAGAGVLPEGGGLEGAVELPSGSPRVVVTIQDLSGAVVRRIDLGSRTAGLASFRWDGIDDNGEPMPSGKYLVSAETELDGRMVALETLIAADVESVTLGRNGQGLVLNLSGLGSLDFSEVRQIS